MLLHWVPGLGHELTRLLAAIHASHLHRDAADPGQLPRHRAAAALTRRRLAAGARAAAASGIGDGQRAQCLADAGDPVVVPLDSGVGFEER